MWLPKNEIVYHPGEEGCKSKQRILTFHKGKVAYVASLESEKGKYYEISRN